MKSGKIAKTYSLATQGIFSMAAYLAIGFFIGYLIDKDSFWPVVLAVVGMLLGLVTFITYLLYLLKDEEKERKAKKDEARSEEE